jgi:hypothetical protein
MDCPYCLLWKELLSCEILATPGVAAAADILQPTVITAITHNGPGHYRLITLVDPCLRMQKKSCWNLTLKTEIRVGGKGGGRRGSLLLAALSSVLSYKTGWALAAKISSI